MLVNTAGSAFSVTVCSVDRQDPIRRRQGERLRRARKAAGYRSAREAALSNAWKESTYRAHESGTRTIGLDDATKYAKRFRAAGANITAHTIMFDCPTMGQQPISIDQNDLLPILQRLTPGQFKLAIAFLRMLENMDPESKDISIVPRIRSMKARP